VYASGKTTPRDDLQSFIACALHLIKVRDIDLVVISAFGVRVCFKFGFTILDGKDVKHLSGEY
jgi:hypothetical protein